MIETTLSELADRFDAFFIDQFGVLLDGANPYPHAVAALSQLAARGRPILILSNSGKRAGPNEARLVQKGFDRRSFDMVLSSGEAAYAALRDWIGTSIPSAARVMVLSRDDDLSCIEGLDLRQTDVPEDADLILLAGSRGDENSLQDYAEMLKDPAERHVPCLCTNPDMTMLTHGEPTFGAGRIAEVYAALGGTVEFVGKPYPLIYEVAAAHLGNPDPARVLCIGDSPAHDIRGGRSAGHATALVRTGIHANEPLADLIAHCSASDQPDFVIPAFRF